ncbi:hypothetical protein ROZALSC1DRAFT_30901, partial [Rozella allomycis CSF55]
MTIISVSASLRIPRCDIPHSTLQQNLEKDSFIIKNSQSLKYIKLVKLSRKDAIVELEKSALFTNEESLMKPVCTFDLSDADTVIGYESSQVFDLLPLKRTMFLEALAHFIFESATIMNQIQKHKFVVEPSKISFNGSQVKMHSIFSGKRSPYYYPCGSENNMLALGIIAYDLHINFLQYQNGGSIYVENAARHDYCQNGRPMFVADLPKNFDLQIWQVVNILLNGKEDIMEQLESTIIWNSIRNNLRISPRKATKPIHIERPLILKNYDMKTRNDAMKKETPEPIDHKE